MFRPSRIAAALCLTLVASCGGGGGSADVEADMRSSTNDMISIMESIGESTDEATLKSELEAVVARMNEIDKALKALPQEEQDAIEQRLEADEELKKRMMAAMGKIMARPDLAGAIEAAMESMPQ